MADKKKDKADEIVDSLAEEMGVADETTPKKKKKSKDMMAGLGGIFDVAPQPKKKKKSEPEPEEEEVEEEEEEEEVEEEASDEEEEEEETSEEEEETEEEEEEEASAEDEEEEEETSEEEEEEEKPKKAAKKKTTTKSSSKKTSTKKSTTKKKASDEEEEEEEPPKKKKKKNAAAIDGVFSPGDDDIAASFDTDGFLDEDDLGDYEPPKQNGTVVVLGGIIAVLVISIVAILVSFTPYGKDVLLVLKGEFRETKLAEKKRKEEEFRKKQLEALERYGNLSIEGTPKYATIKLNGELQYGQTSSGAMRELQLIPGFSNFTNLKVKKKHVVEVSAPGFDTRTFEITKGMWQGIDEEAQGGTGSYRLVATLTPSSPEAKAEFDARMGSDTENEFFGTMTINSSPAGAKIMFNKVPLMNEKGEELKTPVTFDKAYVKNDKGKLEERPVRVDTTFDLGHKIELEFPGQADMPKYITQLNRPMWVCERKTEAELKKLPKEHSPQMECNYKYSLSVDFNGIKSFLKAREEERERIKKANEEIKKKMLEMQGGPTVSDGDKAKKK